MRRPQVQPQEPAEDPAVRGSLVFIQRHPRRPQPSGVPTSAKAFGRAARGIGIATEAAGRASGLEALIELLRARLAFRLVTKCFGAFGQVGVSGDLRHLFQRLDQLGGRLCAFVPFQELVR